jgi:hypothetical protein
MASEMGIIGVEVVVAYFSADLLFQSSLGKTE